MDNGFSDVTPATVDPAVCTSCGQLAEMGRSTPLCASCRCRLASRPLPRWLVISALALLVPFVMAIGRFPATLAAGIAFERGSRAEKAGVYSVALTEYSKVTRQFPDSIMAHARKGIAAFHAGEYQVSEEAFDVIKGSKSSSDIFLEVNDVIEQMKKLQR